MKSLKTSLFLTIGLSATLVLAGCSGASEPQPAQTFVATPTASVAPTPAAGSSSEIDLSKTKTDLKTSEEAPEWAAPLLANLPEAKWVYASDDSQVIATTDSFDPTALKALLGKLSAEGWQVSVPGEDVNGSFIEAMVNPKTGESVTVIGMEKAIPGADGQPDKPASSVVYKK